MNAFFRKLTWLTRRRGKEAELQEELLFHLNEEAEERAGGGLDAAQARLAARRELGNLTRVEEDTRAAWSWNLVEQFLQDIRYAFRTMGANATFSALAILSLALGIGANTAIFSFMDSILLRSLPVPNPESLVTLSWRTNGREAHGMNRHDDSFLDRDDGYGGSIFAYPALEMFRKNGSLFSTVFGYQGAGDLHLAIGNQAEIANTEYVTGDYFRGLGIPPAAGRLIMVDDDRVGAPSVAVISFGLSQRHFGGAANAMGQSIRINNLPFTVIGVAPPEFFGTDPGLLPDVYVPLHANLLLEGDRYHTASASYKDPNYEWIVAMARLRPGVSLAQAQAILSPQFAEWMRTVNTERTRSDLPRLVVRDGSAGLSGLRHQYSRPLFILLAVVALILAIACANIANLLLARAAARRREIAVRLSIGAGRWRVVRQLLTESIMLAFVGGVIGIAFSLWGIHFLTALLANGREDFTLHAALNWRVLLVAGGLSLLTGMLFGLAPALQSTRVDL
jgi:macrolide transport system ATP-binding/permease protein